ncbi:MAG: DUF4115 domain-containing protein [Candidatus Marinimicrobia bacterium]|nr:DUF4115 domain-containing protein [Candidatus Neomarinimicrobiota bacterium]
MIENFGSYLKHERELRGVPLEEISATTKIHIRFLQALENNQFDELPGEVFIKGYIRSFAKTIGSDEDEMINVYNDMVGKALSPEVGDSLIEDKPPVEKKSFLKLGLALVFLVGVGWGINFLIHQFSDSSKKTSTLVAEPDRQETATISKSASLDADALSSAEGIDDLSVFSSAPSQADNPSDSLLSPPAESNENPFEMEGGQDKALESKAKQDTMIGVSALTDDEADNKRTVAATVGRPLKLVIKVRDNVWFNMTVDGSREEDFILPTGAGKTFYGESFFRMTIGDRNGVELTLNDRRLELPPGDENNVVRDFIINSQLIE